MNTQTVAENLKLLTSYYKSVAEVCRRLDINRQQFNKYLNGSTLPSRHTFQRICNFFGVEDYELMLPPDEFRDLVSLRPRRNHEQQAGDLPYVRHVEDILAASDTDTDRYTGYYYAYRHSFTDTDVLQKSLVSIWREDGRVLTKRMERFRDDLGDETGPFLCKYLGCLMRLQDRLFIVEYDALKRREISQTILYPGYRNQVTWLSGLNLGVSTRDDRRIGCARVLYQYLGRKIDLKRAIGHLGKFPAESDEVPNMVRDTFRQSGQVEPEGMLFAVPR